MRIEEDIKLDYSDVLFRPKRSTLSSRKNVNLNRTYKFRYSNHVLGPGVFKDFVMNPESIEGL